MNWLDIVLIAIVGFSTIQSFRKGFAREIIGLAAAAFAILCGMWFYRLVGGFLSPYVSSERLANLAGFLIVVFAVLLCGSMVSWIVNRFLRTIGLSFFDRLFGACLGLARGLLVSIALLTAFIAFGPHAENDTTPQAVLNSKIAPHVLEASRVFVALAPMDLKQSFRSQYAKLKAAWQRSVPKGRGEDL